MPNRIRNFAMILLLAVASGSSVVAADQAVPAGQNAPAGGMDKSKSMVATLREYACAKGTHHKSERAGLISTVMQRGADSQPARIVGVKDSKTGEVAFIYVLESDCSGAPPTIPPGGASLALAHKISGQDYFYAISPQSECLRAFELKFLGQFAPLEMSTRVLDCQSEISNWSASSMKWKAQANAGKTKP